MLYKRERWGDFSYNLPIPSNGDYILILKFADTCLNEIGTRIFDVEIGGEKILEEFDVVKEVGRFTAIDKYFELTIEGSKLIVDDEEVDASWFDGNLLNINFINLGKDNPKLSALILIRKTLDDYMYYIDDGAVTCRNISIDVS